MIPLNPLPSPVYVTKLSIESKTDRYSTNFLIVRLTYHQVHHDKNEF